MSVATNPDCVFCQILDGRIPASLVHRDEQEIGKRRRS